MNSYIGEEQREKTIFYHFKNNGNVFFGHKKSFFFFWNLRNTVKAFQYLSTESAEKLGDGFNLNYYLIIYFDIEQDHIYFCIRLDEPSGFKWLILIT